jgi:hypothetical protein
MIVWHNRKKCWNLVDYQIQRRLKRGKHVPPSMPFTCAPENTLLHASPIQHTTKMAAKDKDHDPEPQDEDYDSNEDEDFNPDNAPAADDELSASSDSEDDDDNAPTTKKTKAKTAKRKAPETIDEELDSGDEATIKERKRKRRKGKDADEDSGGEGGLIKTRAQRLVEKAERKERRRADRGEVTVDVDELWARLSAVPVGRHYEPVSPQAADGDNAANVDDGSGEVVQPSDQLIRIKRRIAFAGEITEVEEEVLKSSAAAKAYLADHPEADPDNKKSRANDAGQRATSEGNLQRPLRRPSIFEPNPTAAVRGVSSDKLRPRAPSRVDVLMAERRLAEEKKKKAERLTTVQKSAMDWKGFVADQGIGEELDIYGKSKGGFMAREQFLDRVAGANEEARRAARLKG